MNFLHSIRADLVEKRLLPVAIVLAALVVLVPVLAIVVFHSSPSPQPVIGPPQASTPPPGTPSPTQALASVAGPGTPAAKHYTKRELDPFRQRPGAVAAQSAAAGSAGSATAVKASTKTPASSPTKTTAVKQTPATVQPKATTKVNPVKPQSTKTTPVATPSPKAQLAKLGSRDSYSVDMNVVDSTGARNLIGVMRLSPLPSSTNPLVEYLGVLKGGRAAAFLVNPGTVVQGPGRCLPKASDCQVLELKPGQLESLGVRTSGGTVSQASIAVSDWRVVSHPTIAAARKARAQEVKQGRTLVTQSAQPALTDLVYTVAQGAISVIPAIVNALPGTLTKILGG
jgi:hypothetical protein